MWDKSCTPTHCWFASRLQTLLVLCYTATLTVLWKSFTVYGPVGVLTGSPYSLPVSCTFWVTVLYSPGTASVLDFPADEEYSYLNWSCKEKKLKRKTLWIILLPAPGENSVSFMPHFWASLLQSQYTCSAVPRQQLQKETSWVWCCLWGTANLCSLSSFASHDWDACESDLDLGFNSLRLVLSISYWCTSSVLGF